MRGYKFYTKDKSILNLINKAGLNYHSNLNILNIMFAADKWVGFCYYFRNETYGIFNKGSGVDINNEDFIELNKEEFLSKVLKISLKKKIG